MPLARVIPITEPWSGGDKSILYLQATGYNSVQLHMEVFCLLRFPESNINLLISSDPWGMVAHLYAPWLQTSPVFTLSSDKEILMWTITRGHSLLCQHWWYVCPLWGQRFGKNHWSKYKNGSNMKILGKTDLLTNLWH